MYIPPKFRLDDPAAIATLLHAHPFALLVTGAGGAVQANHIPLLLEGEVGGDARLSGHLSRANPQADELAALAAEGGEVLAIFQGPHAYVSPRWYETGPAVPTWNYLAVHVYARVVPVADPAELRATLQRQIAAFEDGAPSPYSLDGQDPAYIESMMRGIYPFTLLPTRIEAKAKLSQNRPQADARGVVAALRASGGAEEGALADWTERVTLGVPAVG